jgi:hypothetical protein
MLFFNIFSLRYKIIYIFSMNETRNHFSSIFMHTNHLLHFLTLVCMCLSYTKNSCLAIMSNICLRDGITPMILSSNNKSTKHLQLVSNLIFSHDLINVYLAIEKKARLLLNYLLGIFTKEFQASD